MVTLDQAIDTVSQLPPQQQQMLMDILYHRQIDLRRQEIALDAQRSLAEFRAGKLKPQPLDDVLAELEATLDDSTDDDTLRFPPSPSIVATLSND